MKLQIALDGTDLDGALALAEQVRQVADILEAGTPLILQHGMAAVEALRARFPEKLILADMKIMDGGAGEARQAMEAGADYVTALAVAEDATLAGCVEAVRRCGGRLVADMLCVSDLEGRARTLEALGVDLLAVHTGVDQQAAGRTPLEDLKRLRACAGRAGVAVAGGINAETAAAYAACGPDVVIVGGAVCRARDPGAAARAIARGLGLCAS